MTKRGAREQAIAGRSYGHGAECGDERDRLAMHHARCRICRHPEREEIEREFLDWVSPREIAERWKIASYRAIYRHAQAVGLQEQRRRNRQGALDCIIEHVGEVTVTASAVVAAIRLGAKLEREAESEADGERGGPGFVLSLGGLPRTNAVTGRAPAGEGATQTLKPFGRADNAG
jgi:hypothetical protein